jgi:hypothetical protein
MKKEITLKIANLLLKTAKELLSFNVGGKHGEFMVNLSNNMVVVLLNKQYDDVRPGQDQEVVNKFKQDLNKLMTFIVHKYSLSKNQIRTQKEEPIYFSEKEGKGRVMYKFAFYAPKDKMNEVVNDLKRNRLDLTQNLSQKAVIDV